MNKSYRLVWSVVRGAWTVVSELAKSHAKSGAAIVVVAAAAVALPTHANDFRFLNADGTTPDASYSDFKTLTVNTYKGATNGKKEANVYMNTRLNGDDVTGTYSDKIVVRDGGNMSGDTTFHFANAGSAGAATYDGIKFVDAQGTASLIKATSKLQVVMWRQARMVMWVVKVNTLI